MGPPLPPPPPSSLPLCSSPSSSLCLFIFVFLLLPIAFPLPMRTSADGAQLSIFRATQRTSRLPDELMNPVYRQQMRQRLRMLDAMRRKAMFDASSRALSPPSSLLPAPPSLHHRNCFFSPINCHLPVMAARSPSIKRHIDAKFLPLYSKSRGSRQQSFMEDR